MKRLRRTAWRCRGIAFIGIWCAIAVLGASVLASYASAASSYVYEICDPAIPGGSTAGVTFKGDPAYVRAVNACAQPGGNISIYAVTSRSKDTGAANHWTLPIGAPPGGRVESLAISAETCGASGISNDFAFEPGWPGNCRGESQRTFHATPESPLSEASVHLDCVSTCEPGAWIYARYLAATEVDPVAPQPSAPQGSLFEGAVARGHQSVSADATDVGGGVREVELRINGQSVGNPNTPHCNVAQVANQSIVGLVAAAPSPCPASVKSTWTVDTAAYPFQNGSNSVQICASDFSTLGEANSSCSAARAVNVDNSCTESPVGGGVTLSAQFAGSQDEKITVPFEHSAEVVGALANGSGEAITGATICVQTQTLGSPQGLAPVATATTDARGHFSYKVPPGPNRTVLVGYRHDTFQLARSVRYYAHAKPTIRITPSKTRLGGRVRISGKVPGPTAGGRGVVLQASALHSNVWFQFDRATTNQHGVFSSHYRFDETRRTTTYRIRAEVFKQRGYPWAAGVSRPARVEVRAGGPSASSSEFVSANFLRSFEANSLDFRDSRTAGVTGDAPRHAVRSWTNKWADLEECHFAIARVAEAEATGEQTFTGCTARGFAVGGGPFGIGGNGV